jgi:hypothetical protein
LTSCEKAIVVAAVATSDDDVSVAVLLIWLVSSEEVIVVAAVATSDIGVHWGSCDPEYNDCRTRIESTIEETTILVVNLRQAVKVAVEAMASENRGRYFLCPSSVFNGMCYQLIALPMDTLRDKK